METAKKRLRYFIDFKGDTLNKFSKKNLLSHGFFTIEGAIGSDKLDIILKNYAELNADWVITGRGEMLLKNEIENVVIENTDISIIEDLRATIAVQNKLIERLENEINFTKKIYDFPQIETAQVNEPVTKYGK